MLGSFHTTRTPFSKVVEHVAALDWDEARDFYQVYLKDVPPQPELPNVDDPRQFRTFELALEASLADMERDARAAGVSLHAITQAAYAVALAEHLQISDIVRRKDSLTCRS